MPLPGSAPRPPEFYGVPHNTYTLEHRSNIDLQWHETETLMGTGEKGTDIPEDILVLLRGASEVFPDHEWRIVHSLLVVTPLTDPKYHYVPEGVETIRKRIRKFPQPDNSGTVE